MPNHTGYLDFTTIPITYRVIGEVNNIGASSQKYVKVTATFYDQTHSLIGSKSSYTFLDVLLPGRTAPFEIVWVNTTANQIYNYSLTSEYTEIADEKNPALQILESATYVDEARFLKVNGTVKNLGTANATAVKVAATFYNTQGTVLDVASGYTSPSTIMPNHTEPFELELRRKEVTFSSYKLTLESMEYAAVLPAVTALKVSLTLNPTIVNSGANVSMLVHVTNGTVPVEESSVQLGSDKGGVFQPQSGYTNSSGYFVTTYTAPTVTAQTSITITANATRTGFILGQNQEQITVNPISQPNQATWIYLAALVIVVASLGATFLVAGRRRRKRRIIRRRKKL